MERGQRLALLAVVAGVMAAGCGGGNRDYEDDEEEMLRLSGTAATGLALANAQVSAKCRQGSGNALTLADGSYRLDIRGGGLPCVLQATPAGGEQPLLHTLALGEGRRVVANLTPLTEMVTVRVARGEAAGYFARFDASAGAKLSRDRLNAAQADVRSLLAGTVDLRPLGDLLATPLQAATTAAPTGGDAQDKLLDEINKRLSRERRTQMLAALGSGAVPADPDASPFVPALKVEPRELVLESGATRVLLADLNYAKGAAPLRQPVNWKVLEADGGKVDAVSGFYEAPSKAGTYRVRATREDHPSVNAVVTINVQPFRTVEQAGLSSVLVAQNLVIRDATAWSSLWAQHVQGRTPAPALPAVNFANEMVLAVFAGQKPSACDGVSILEARQAGNKLQVLFREQPGTAAATCATLLGAPVHLVRLPRSNLTVEFQRKSP